MNTNRLQRRNINRRNFLSYMKGYAKNLSVNEDDSKNGFRKTKKVKIKKQKVHDNYSIPSGRNTIRGCIPNIGTGYHQFYGHMYNPIRQINIEKKLEENSKFEQKIITKIVNYSHKKIMFLCDDPRDIFYRQEIGISIYDSLSNCQVFTASPFNILTHIKSVKEVLDRLFKEANKPQMLIDINIKDSSYQVYQSIKEHYDILFESKYTNNTGSEMMTIMLKHKNFIKTSPFSF